MNPGYSGQDYYLLIGLLLILAGYIVDRLLNKAYRKYDKDKENEQRVAIRMFADIYLTK